MPSYKIIESKPVLLGIDLERPFLLGFGSLQYLPRVLLKITARTKGKIISGIGEASIDFPFSTYDAWDIYWVLSNLNLEAREVNREDILTDQEYRSEILSQFPAAFTALNMAVDDIHGKIEGKSILNIYHQQRESGTALASVSFKNKAASLVDEAQNRYNHGFIPKIKVGRNITEDVRDVKAIAKVSCARTIPFALDFNARYEPDEFSKIVKRLRSDDVDISNLLFIEQPTTEDSSIAGLVHAKNVLRKYGYKVPIIADESFVTLEDAIHCVSADICLNFKIHKIGGVYHAKEIESVISGVAPGKLENMVGGTFPTAIGRAYDQQAAAILESTSLPSDGWEPSTAWFRGEKHLIKEKFQFDRKTKKFKPFRGDGLGINPNWDKIKKFIIPNPRNEYQRIRSQGSGNILKIDLKTRQTYAEVYKKRSGRDLFWNL